MAIRLGANQYGKAEVRVVAVDRSTPRHTLVDLNVSSSLRGDFTAAHTAGDNAHVLATAPRRTPSSPSPGTASARRRRSRCGWPATSPAPTRGSYGLIEGTVLRDEVPPAEVAWTGTPGS